MQTTQTIEPLSQNILNSRTDLSTSSLDVRLVQLSKSNISLVRLASVSHTLCMLPSRVDRSRLIEAIETQTLLLHEEQATTADIDNRLAAAQKIIDEYGRARQASIGRQVILTNGILLYQSLLNLAEERDFTDPKDQPVIQAHIEPRIKPARIGKQHYRMLHAIRDNGPIPLGDLASSAHVLPRRAKIQMADDVERGLVVIVEHGYELTPEGADVLRRFEDYRHSNGIELPSLDVSDSEDERDEADPEIHTEEEAA